MIEGRTRVKRGKTGRMKEGERERRGGEGEERRKEREIQNKENGKELLKINRKEKIKE